MIPERTGPRPLALHLAAAAAISASSLLAWPLLKNGWLTSNGGSHPGNPPDGNPLHPGSPEAEDPLHDLLASVNPDSFAIAVAEELSRRHDAFLTGLESYRTHSYVRTVEPPPAVWESGPARLLDYGVTDPAGVDGSPVLFVPSLVNRSYIMDLTARRSLMRFLAARGFRPLLLDWGTPGPPELAMGFDDCIGGTMRAALAVANGCAGGPVSVVGYCMGGTMATALACLSPDRVSALALLATPWDFHADIGGPPPTVVAGRMALEALLATMGYLPVDAIQTLFFSLDPVQGWSKFRAFARLPPGSPRAATFVALEDWLNDGIPLAAPIARDCLFGWYGENLTARGRWTVCGERIDPATLRIPALAVLPAGDRIVPPASAAALADALPNARRIVPPGGHIGMMVGGKARTLLWTPLAEWLDAQRSRRRTTG